MKKTLTTLSFYIWCFYACSFLGWVYESVWKSINRGHFYNSGFLHGFYVPIYGFGGLLLIFALKKLMSKEVQIKIWKINLKPIVMFVLILILVSALEYFASVLLELIFDKRWWDYSYDKIHINGRVSLRNSSILALLGFVFVYIVHPLMSWLRSKVNLKVLIAVAAVILLVMGADTVVTCLERFGIIGAL